MTEREDSTVPGAVHRRDDPGVDPPTIEFGMSLDLHMTEGDVVLFLDQDHDPARTFELHRSRSAFRLGDGIAPLQGVFASAQAAVREGWAALDGGPAGGLPPVDALLGTDGPVGGAA